jgi:hypothetical protein
VAKFVVPPRIGVNPRATPAFGLNLRMGVNIFDRDQPMQGLAQGNGNSYPQMFDPMGRYLFAGFTVDFQVRARQSE